MKFRLIDDKELNEEFEYVFEMEENEEEENNFLSYCIFESMELHDAKICHKKDREGD